MNNPDPPRPGGKRASRFRFLFLIVALVGCLCAGCVSANPQKFSRQVQKWVPLGTPMAEAGRVMKHHGFDCTLVTKNHPFNPYGLDYLDCEREQVWMHDWRVELFLEDGKVSKYGRIKVDEDSM